MGTPHGRRLALLTLWLVSASDRAFAWGTAGHQIVAELAQAMLSPAARDQVAALLDGASLASVSTYADEVRNDHPETKRWHFVDIPRAEVAYLATRDCAPEAEGDCVIAAIERAKAALADRAWPRAERAEALKFLVHFVGDLHQPLHAVDDHDLGGNIVRVTFFGRPMNLHSLWDSGLIDHTGLSVPAYVQLLQGTMPGGSGTTIEWAEEAHRAAVEHVYALPDDHNLDQAYYDANRPVVDQQLARAGARLGNLLNELLGR